MADYKDLEILVASIQKQLAPQSNVRHNVRLPGRRSETERQIDVLVEQQVGQFEIKIIIDAKDYARPVDVKGVEEFYGLLDDVAAQKGVLVCPAGFTEAAKKRATDYLIELYSPIDTGPHKWKLNPAIPALCDFREAMIAFGISCRAPFPFQMTMDFYDTLIAHDATGAPLGTPREIAMSRWNDGDFPQEPGEHKDLNIFKTPEVLVDNGHNMRVPVTLTATLYVEQQLYFGHFPITNISGFKDEVRGRIITNAFTVGMLDPHLIAEKWKRVQNPEEAPVKPVIRMQGLWGWVGH